MEEALNPYNSINTFKDILTLKFPVLKIYIVTIQFVLKESRLKTPMEIIENAAKNY